MSVIVGYTAHYALYVHEAPMTMKGQPRTVWYTDSQGRRRKTNIPRKGLYWDPQSRATNKFLERPFREKQREIRKVIRTTAQKTGSYKYALIQGGLYLQRVSQEMVPVDTGNLKASAFTRLEK